MPRTRILTTVSELEWKELFFDVIATLYYYLVLPPDREEINRSNEAFHMQLA